MPILHKLILINKHFIIFIQQLSNNGFGLSAEQIK